MWLPTDGRPCPCHVLAALGRAMLALAVVLAAPAGAAGSRSAFATDAGFRVVKNLVGYIGSPASPILELPDGSLLGTSSTGGDLGKGLVFRLTPGGDLTVVHSFTGNPDDGESPIGSLVRTPDGDVYGTTTSGGTNDWGTVFRISPDGVYATATGLFPWGGVGPSGGLTLGDDGNLYGTTTGGGSSYSGTLYRISPSGSHALLYSFGADGRNPCGTLTSHGPGRLVGTTAYGGAFGNGTLFEFDPATGTVTTLHSFGAAEGAIPWSSPIAGPDGTLYGVTSSGGTHEAGTLYRYSAGTGVQPIFSFPSPPTGGSASALVVDSESNLYGTWWGGGSDGAGSVFRFSGSGVFTTLHSFSGTDGAFPRAPLSWARDGTLLGSTSGQRFPGSVFRMTTEGALTTIRLFDDPDGEFPFSDLTQGLDGDLYWTTSNMSSSGGGVVRASPDGSIRFVHQFGSTNLGWSPRGGVTVGVDGALWGVNFDVGPSLGGTVFRISETNEVTAPHAFSHESIYHPNARLLRSADGYLYGSTASAPPGNWGSVFRVDANGQTSTVHLFSWTSLEGTPEGRLLEDSQGNLSGVTPNGGHRDSQGTIYRLRADRSLEWLHTFGWSDGASPSAGLVWGADGALYGTTFQGGSSGYGTVFRLPIGGTLEVLHEFAGPDGAGPMTSLTLSPSGYLYGTTRFGGNAQNGTIFRISPSGRFATIRAFSGTDGSMPASALLRMRNDVYLGLTVHGGSQLGGVLYEFTAPAAPPAPSSVTPAAGPASGGTRVTISGAGFTSGAHVWFGGVLAPSVQVVSPTLLVATTPPHSPGTFDVAVGNPDDQSDLLEQAFRFDPAPPPVVESVSPSFGPVEGGTRVELRGSRLRLDTTVSFGTSPSPRVDWVSDTRMFAVAPPHSAGLVDVIVANPDSLPSSFPGSFLFSPEPSPTGWYPVTPCRLVDTRGTSGPSGGPGLAPDERRRFALAPSAPCGVPATARALTTNVTAVVPTASGEIRIYPGDAPWTGTATVPFRRGVTRANNAMLKLADDGSGSVWAWNASRGTVHLVIDVTGYFQ